MARRAPSEFTFGRDGKAFLHPRTQLSRSPQAAAITQRIHDGGRALPHRDDRLPMRRSFPAIEGELDELEELDDNSPDDADEESSGDRHVENDA